MELVRLEEELDEVRETFKSGKTKSFAWRKSQLQGLRQLILENEEEILTVLKEDLGKHRVEAFRDEVGFLIKSVNYHLDNIKNWVTPTKINIPIVAFPSSCELVQEPLGVILILSAWNFPIALALEPLMGAISAGNAIVLKPSEIAPSSSAFLADMVPKYLDAKSVKVVQGGADIGGYLLERKWDKILFTGSTRVGRIVMTAAAKHLTPVALELGGKCPAIVDSLTAFRDRKVSVDRIVGGKWGSCSGQACIGIDYLLVEEKFAPIVVEMLKKTLERFYPSQECSARIVNKHHFKRLSNLLNDPAVASSIVHGGSQDYNNLIIEPTILLDPPLDSAIMMEEIFGPLLPVITVKNIEDSIDFVRERPKPLVIYAFTNNEKLKRRIIDETSSGSITFNDTLVQYVCDTIPFGGVGESGFGQYHGKFSFDMFSHGKPVLRRNFLTEFTFRYPPWTNQKLQLMRHLYRFDYIGFALAWLGLKR